MHLYQLNLNSQYEKVLASNLEKLKKINRTNNLAALKGKRNETNISTKIRYFIKGKV